MIARRDRLKALGLRAFTPTPGDPFEVVADRRAGVPDRLPARQGPAATSQDRPVPASVARAAPRLCVVAALQDPRKDILSFRNLFPTRIALRLAEDSEVDMVLGDGALDDGARCHEIPLTLPGVGYVRLDGIPAPTRVRFPGSPTPTSPT